MTNRKFPFAAIVGLERPRHALMLLAVDPALRGVLITSPPGTGKSVLARSFPSLVWECGAVSSSPSEMKPVVGASSSAGRKPGLPITVPFVEMPLGITEDMLLGGVDFGSTLVGGRRLISTGLLARANGGFIYVDHINLLESANLRHLLTALDSGVVVLEREGISGQYEARFALIGTMNTRHMPAEWDLKDRVGLIVENYENPSDAERAEIIDRTEQFIRDPDGFCEQFAAQQSELRQRILAARELLSSITIDRFQISGVSAAAVDLGIQSSRADLLAVRAARASAALRRSAQVEDVDLTTAIDYVLMPRAGGHAARPPVKTQKLAQDDVGLEDLRESPSEALSGTASPKATFPGAAPFQPAESDLERCESEQHQQNDLETVIHQPQDCALPGELAGSVPTQRGSRRKAGATSGRRAERAESSHGRYVGAVPAADRYNQIRRIAIDATLRAAAPHQKLRRAAADRGRDVQSENARVIVKPDDLRLKRLKHRTGLLFIFLVDTSGSMALGRIGHAKGVMIRLLRQAYLHRDSVAMIAFRGTSTEVVLEPTSSVELARRAIESMPAGGGTPLAAGLASAIALVERAQKKMVRETMLLVFTDGRVNVALKSPRASGRAERDRIIKAELRDMGRRLLDHDIKAIVIDTGSWDAEDGRCASISAAIGARYCRLPRSGPDGLYRQVREFAAES